MASKEDGRTGYLIIIWESYEHHMKLKKDPAYPEMIKSLGLAVSGPIDVQHVDFDATKALDAPATEISVITLKADTSLEDFHAKSTAVREHLNNEPSCHAMVGGESRENKGTYFSLTGWDNIQVFAGRTYDLVERNLVAPKSHIDLTAKDEFKEFVKNFLEIADIDVAHSNMVKYPA
ncbi:hypothetical protein H0H81_003240 [Sphagnurus paluster]|uniref:ABM domain-containing protein n=1 Tax=Sphagnurus paluster TaxID=117069 RepID=A0A9P7GLI7_9AGAR|nr:hypothetical protein H0H81_003240 [Sphagnurus paluster]